MRKGGDPKAPALLVSAEGVHLGGCGLGADAAGRGDGGLVGLPLFPGQLAEGVDGAGRGGEEGEGGETGLGGELAGAGGLGVEAHDAVPIFVAVFVGELHGQLAGDGDFGGVEGGGAVGGTDEGTDDALEVDAHARLVDGGGEDLGGLAELLLGGFADLVEIDRLEAEGGAELVGLNGAWGEAGDEFEGDCLAVLRGASSLGSGLLSVLDGHLIDLSTKAGGSQSPMPCISASVRIDQAG
jgi:hypothetical protein